MRFPSVHRTAVCLIALALSSCFASLTGCHPTTWSSVSPPYAPPSLTFDQARMQAHAAEARYVNGYANPGYSPAIFTIPGHPFTAKRTYLQWPADGSPDDPSITTAVTIARDSAGRIHYESSRSRGTVDILISDPVAHIQYRYWLKPRQLANPPAEQCTQPLMRDITSRAGTDPLSRSRFQLAAYPVPSQRTLGTAADLPPEGREELGTQQLQGFVSYGQHEVLHVQRKGQVEAINREEWFAPELGLDMLVSADITPQLRNSTRTHDIALAEPDPALFHPPANYVSPAEVPSCVKTHR